MSIPVLGFNLFAYYGTSVYQVELMSISMDMSRVAWINITDNQIIVLSSHAKVSDNEIRDLCVPCPNDAQKFEAKIYSLH